MGVECVVANVSGGDAQDGDACWICYLPLQAVEMRINGLRFPSSVGKYRVVHLGENPFGRQDEHGAGLNSGAEGKGAELRLI